MRNFPSAEALAPAIRLAEEGFPVHPVAAQGWARGAPLLQATNNPHGAAMLMPDGSVPSAGDVMKMPELAATFRELAAKGKPGGSEEVCAGDSTAE